jgi:hypothetical protein
MTEPTLNREKLARVLGLLGSSFEGEVVTAARQAERLRRDAGLTWNDILLPAALDPDDIGNADDAIDFCVAYKAVLTEWERKFIESLAERHWSTLTEKQMAVLVRLVAKCRRAGTAA